MNFSRDIMSALVSNSIIEKIFIGFFYIFLHFIFTFMFTLQVHILYAFLALYVCKLCLLFIYNEHLN